MTRVVVDRKLWYRGRGALDSKLLRPSDDRMCCLGFAALALGIPGKAIYDVGTPAHIEAGWLDGSRGAQPFPGMDRAGLQTHCGAALERMIMLNDSPSLVEAIREHQISVAGATIGLYFEFVGGEDP